MGLLDNPQDAAMLQMGLGLLSAGGPSRMPVSLGQAIGSAGNQAMDAYRQTQLMQERQAQRKLQEQMGGLKLQQHQMQLQEAQRKQSALQQFRDQLPEPLRPAFDVDPAGFMARLKPKEPQYKEINGTLVRIVDDGVAPVYTAPPDPTKMSRKDELEFQSQLRRDEREFAARIAAANRQPEAPNLVQVDVNGQPQFVPARQAVGMKPWMDPKANNAAAVKGSPEKRAAEARMALPIIDQAEKLLNNATGSYIGTGIDSAAQAFGISTKGAQAGAQLKILEAQLIQNMPRMEGPQSDKDVQLYKQAAAQIGDSTVPPPTKKAALATLREIQTRYADMGGVAQPSPAMDLQSAAAAELARRRKGANGSF